MPKLIVTIASAITLAAAGVAAFAVISSSGASAVTEPTLTTPAEAISMPNAHLTLAPVSAQALASAQTAGQDTVRSFCKTIAAGVGCFSASPDSIQFVDATLGNGDTSDVVENLPTYLLTWNLTGTDCIQAVPIMGPPGESPKISLSDKCIYQVMVNPTTEKQYVSWDNPVN